MDVGAMAVRCDLAMCAGEFLRSQGRVHGGAWMACHFSPHGDALTNVPRALPAGTLLIIDDSTPMCAHDATRIAEVLASAVDASKCGGVLLDFERPPTQETRALVRRLVDTLSCPIAVPQSYATSGCAVFLAPVPPDVPIERHLAPWRDREVWLEIAPSALTLTLTPQGCTRQAGAPQLQLGWHSDTRLCCHYAIQKCKDGVRFYLTRTGEDLRALMAQAEAIGVTRAVGLYQELAGIL